MLFTPMARGASDFSSEVVLPSLLIMGVGVVLAIAGCSLYSEAKKVERLESENIKLKADSAKLQQGIDVLSKKIDGNSELVAH